MLAFKDYLVDLSVPFFNESKEKIVFIVGYFPGIKGASVYTIFREICPREVSSKAVYKSLKELVDEQVLVFDFESKKYFVSDDWINVSMNAFQKFSERKKVPLQTILLK